MYEVHLISSQSRILLQRVPPPMISKNMCQIIAIIFQGTNNGSDIETKHTATKTPFFGMDNAIAMPRGISIIKMIAENNRLRPKLSQKRPESIISLYHSKPTHILDCRVIMSCNE